MKFTKKLLITTALCALTSLPVSAANIEFTIGSSNFLTENDADISEAVLEAAPFINESGRTMVPVRAVSTAFDADVLWDDASRTVTVKKNDKEIILTIDSPEAYINGSATALDSAPVIISGRTFVPLRFIGEALSCNVNYAAATKQIILDDSPILIKSGNYTISLSEFKEIFNTYKASIIANNEGLSEEDIFDLALNSSLDTASNIVRIQNKFPNISFTEEDLNEISEAINDISEIYTPNLSGFNAVFMEKYYYSLGNPVIRSYVNTLDMENIFKSDYVRAKHILVDSEELANEIYASLQNGADFDELLNEYGTDPGMTYEPDGYTFTKDYMDPAFEAAAFALNIGEISAPVKSSYGYHIIKREELPDLTDELKWSIAYEVSSEDLIDAAESEFLMTDEEIAALLK